MNENEANEVQVEEMDEPLVGQVTFDELLAEMRLP